LAQAEPTPVTVTLLCSPPPWATVALVLVTWLPFCRLIVPA